MIGLLFWLLSAIFRGASLSRHRLRRPKRFYATPKVHLETARRVIQYTNQARARHNLQPLSRYLALQSAAQGHSNWMARHSFSHTGYQGSTPHQRIKAIGFAGEMTAENIYKFPARRDQKRLARDLVDGWMKSPGHRANILNGQLTYIGVGIAQSGNYIYASQNFGG